MAQKTRRPRKGSALPADLKAFDFVSSHLVGEGRNRLVYLHPDGKHVLKVPRVVHGLEDICACSRKECTCLGELDNWAEATAYGRQSPDPDPTWIRYASCRLLPGTSILEMELVDTSTKAKKPSWADCIDCQQVGLNAEGQWVAYDFGID